MNGERMLTNGEHILTNGERILTNGEHILTSGEHPSKPLTALEQPGELPGTQPLNHLVNYGTLE